MAQRTTFAKLQRERAKKQKAEEKRARRQGVEGPAAAPVDRGPSTTSVRVPDVEGDGSPLAPDELLDLVEELTAAHEAGLITDEELARKRGTLMARI